MRPWRPWVISVPLPISSHSPHTQGKALLNSLPLIHSFSKNLLITYHPSGTVLAPGDVMTIKTNENIGPRGTHNLSLHEEQRLPEHKEMPTFLGKITKMWVRESCVFQRILMGQRARSPGHQVEREERIQGVSRGGGQAVEGGESPEAKGTKAPFTYFAILLRINTVMKT